MNIEHEEERPQVVQLKAGDLDEKAYMELKSKEEIENGANSFGKILFKKPQKKSATEPESATTEIANEHSAEKKQSEIDLIFNLDKNGAEIPKEAADEEAEVTTKKTLLNEESEENVKYGLQEPPSKKRYIDGPTTKVTSISASKVLAREAKCGNKKLLSFYDEEEEAEDDEENDAKNSSDDE